MIEERAARARGEVNIQKPRGFALASRFCMTLLRRPARPAEDPWPTGVDSAISAASSGGTPAMMSRSAAGGPPCPRRMRRSQIQAAAAATTLGNTQSGARNASLPATTAISTPMSCAVGVPIRSMKTVGRISR